VILLTLVGFGQRDCSGATLGSPLVGRTHPGEWVLILHGVSWLARMELASHEAEDQPKKDDDDDQPQDFQDFFPPCLRASVVEMLLCPNWPTTAAVI
jgi:hypothetical protein